MSAYNFATRNNLTKLSMWPAGGRRDNEGMTKFERAKTSKIWRVFSQLSTWWQIYPEQIHVTKIGNALDQVQTLPHWTKKLVNFGPLTILHALQPPKLYFQGGGRPQVGLCPIFLV